MKVYYEIGIVGICCMFMMFVCFISRLLCNVFFFNLSFLLGFVTVGGLRVFDVGRV